MSDQTAAPDTVGQGLGARTDPPPSEVSSPPYNIQLRESLYATLEKLRAEVASEEDIRKVERQLDALMEGATSDEP